MLLIGIGVPLPTDVSVYIATAGPVYILETAVSYQISWVLSLCSPGSPAAPGTGALTPPDLLNRRKNRNPWRWRHLPPGPRTPALETKVERAQETPGTPAPQPQPPQVLAHCFPFYNNKKLDYEATTPCSYPDFNPRCSLISFIASTLHLFVTPSSFRCSKITAAFEFFIYPNQTPTLPSRHLFLPGRTTTMKRSRAKGTKERRMNEERWSDNFFYFLLLL